MASPYEIEGAVYYDCYGDAEELTHRHPDDAIEAYLDELGPEALASLETVTLCGFKRMQPDWKREAAWLVDDLLERLDEELGDPLGEGSKATPGMLAAADAFLEAFRAEYEPWACEPCGSVMVDAQAWVREHRPDWLKAKQ